MSRWEKTARHKSEDAPCRQRSFGRDRAVLGRKGVLELLRENASLLEAIYVADRAVLSEDLRTALAQAGEQGVPVKRCSREFLQRFGAEVNDQGIAALLRERRVWSVDEVIRAGLKPGAAGVLVVLDQIVDPQNLGSITRAAEAAGADGILYPKRRSAPVTAAVRKASAGASELIPMAAVTNLSRVLETLKRQGYWIAGAALGERTRVLYEAEIPRPAAFVFGSEGEGLRRLTASMCDVLIEIPMPGRIQSLNVGQAAAVVLFEALRRWKYSSD
ncbi:MAG TPA: 23S rRNA (guanosine(2251)-2'-O)-methyltransferase RlmB [Oligoflexia bacterium]|nr:23S rRNA (guanosine(2251)-2'-O)-methyltransferase RlmB [Oligoflexia bacterium]